MSLDDNQKKIFRKEIQSKLKEDRLKSIFIENEQKFGNHFYDQIPGSDYRTRIINLIKELDNRKLIENFIDIVREDYSNFAGEIYEDNSTTVIVTPEPNPKPLETGNECVSPDTDNETFPNAPVSKQSEEVNPDSKLIDIKNCLSKFINEELPSKQSSVKSFDPMLLALYEADYLPFVRITAEILKILGGEYADYGEQILQQKIKHHKKLQPFEFETVTVNARGEVINKEQKRAYYFVESLNKELGIEMVKIPGGTFLMGSPEDERGHNKSESPQHTVTVQPFFMGKYPVTQAQWRFVAQLRPCERELEINPSRFKGDNLPVEQVSWYDTEEFCKRLSKHTGREYRLPSESEWEYACRAETTTPFYFGETITGDLANYAANNTFAEEPKGKRQEKTAKVGDFPPNFFGLYDMHGSTWEWCLDNWHDNYKGAPVNSSAWVGYGNGNNYKVARGGSWGYNPGHCRSASRYAYNRSAGRAINVNIVGFRVVCAFGRALQ